MDVARTKATNRSLPLAVLVLPHDTSTHDAVRATVGLPTMKSMAVWHVVVEGSPDSDSLAAATRVSTVPRLHVRPPKQRVGLTDVTLSAERFSALDIRRELFRAAGLLRAECDAIRGNEAECSRALAVIRAAVNPAPPLPAPPPPATVVIFLEKEASETIVMPKVRDNHLLTYFRRLVASHLGHNRFHFMRRDQCVTHKEEDRFIVGDIHDAGTPIPVHLSDSKPQPPVQAVAQRQTVGLRSPAVGNVAPRGPQTVVAPASDGSQSSPKSAVPQSAATGVTQQSGAVRNTTAPSPPRPPPPPVPPAHQVPRSIARPVPPQPFIVTAVPIYAAQPIHSSVNPIPTFVPVSPMTPPGLICTASDDFMFVHPYHNAWLSVICVVGLVSAGLLINLIVGNRLVGIIVVFVICCIALPVCAWFTTQQRVVFCKSRREVQLMQKRLLLHFCGDQIITVIAFNEIVNVGFSGDANVPGELVLASATNRIVLGQRQHFLTMEVQSEVVAWQVYAASLIGTSLEAFMARSAPQVTTEPLSP